MLDNVSSLSRLATSQSFLNMASYVYVPGPPMAPSNKGIVGTTKAEKTTDEYWLTFAFLDLLVLSIVGFSSPVAKH